ncbi:Spherulation-specific family 4-domain-containing protein [Apiospora hydei]|uniref:Spherulation-specific family 4-domain-containing protein n=1 Tax=Apiospora hydei TaxID=1337664 RepID=A0ABR1V852_9PEZI
MKLALSSAPTQRRHDIRHMCRGGGRCPLPTGHSLLRRDQPQQRTKEHLGLQRERHKQLHAQGQQLHPAQLRQEQVDQGGPAEPGWAGWVSEAGWASLCSNILIHGIWSDETVVEKGNETAFRQPTDHVRQGFAAKGTNRGQFDIVMNPAEDHEQALSDTTDAVVTRETYWATTVGGECPWPYAYYN